MSNKPSASAHGETASPPRYRNQAARNVLAVLAALADADTAYGVSELSRLLGMSKNMVHRALTTLGEDGFAVRDNNTHRYRLGYRVLALGAADAGDFDIGTICSPYLHRLHALTGESVYLSIIVGAARVTIDELLPPGPRVLRSLRGAPVPLHCTKMSRVLLAHCPDPEIDAYLDAAAPLPRPMRFPDPQSETAAGVWADVNAIRTADHVFWRNPHHSSAAYTIIPILDDTGRPHAIVTIGGPRERFDIARMRALSPAMLALIEPLRRHAQLFAAPSPVVEAA